MISSLTDTLGLGFALATFAQSGGGQVLRFLQWRRVFCGTMPEVPRALRLRRVTDVAQ